MRKTRRQTIEFTPSGQLLPCPVCGWVCDGLIEAELWRHLAGSHDAVAKATRAEREVAGFSVGVAAVARLRPRA